VNELLLNAGCGAREKSILLQDILVGDEKTLESNGFKFYATRQKVLKAAHSFHCQPWNQSAMLLVRKEQNIR